MWTVFQPYNNKVLTQKLLSHLTQVPDGVSIQKAIPRLRTRIYQPPSFPSVHFTLSTECYVCLVLSKGWSVRGIFFIFPDHFLILSNLSDHPDYHSATVRAPRKFQHLRLCFREEISSSTAQASEAPR